MDRKSVQSADIDSDGERVPCVHGTLLGEDGNDGYAGKLAKREEMNMEENCRHYWATMVKDRPKEEQALRVTLKERILTVAVTALVASIIGAIRVVCFIRGHRGERNKCAWCGTTLAVVLFIAGCGL
jgi:hypothetical protein